MELTTWIVIVPLSLAALLTGVVQSLGTPWGLFRHRWIVAKLCKRITVANAVAKPTRTLGWTKELRPECRVRV
jgi:hypothetical protein